MATFQDAVLKGAQLLAQADISGVRVEARKLLGTAVGVDRATAGERAFKQINRPSPNRRIQAAGN